MQLTGWFVCMTISVGNSLFVVVLHSCFVAESGRKFRQLCLFEDVLVCVKQKGSGR